MAKLIPAAERLVRARKLIQKAKDYPAPTTGLGKSDLSYVATIKDLLRQAKDMIKFISMTPTASAEMKAEVKKIYEEIEQAEKEILT
jgi:inactivated superfamily I helicase